MTQSSILFEAQDGYAVVTLNRPDRLNSFNVEMHERLREAVSEIKRRDDVRAVLLTGAGRGFCAGQDLSDRAVKADAAPVDLGYTLSTFYNPLIRTLRELPKPVISRGERRRGGRRRQPRPLGRHRHRRTLRELRPGVLQDRPRARLRRHATSCRA